MYYILFLNYCSFSILTFHHQISNPEFYIVMTHSESFGFRNESFHTTSSGAFVLLLSNSNIDTPASYILLHLHTEAYPPYKALCRLSSVYS